MKKAQDKRRRNKKSLKTVTIMLTVITFTVWLLLLFYKYVTTGVDFAQMRNDIISNILGILPPIIIFNFVYEYLTKDYVADEMSGQMLETLTGNSEMMDTFKEDVRKSFIKSTIESLVTERKVEMVYGVLQPYISEHPYNMRTCFKYHIHLSNYYRNQNSIESALFDPNEYYLLSEKLSYKKIFAKKNITDNIARVGFFVDTFTLEQELKGQNFIFRESLKINSQELDKLIELSDERKKKFVEECIQLQVYINGVAHITKSVDIDKSGISVALISNSDIDQDEIEVTIGFKLPQIKRRSEFLVSISEPTQSPEIIFTYQPETTKVVAYQFMNNDSKLLKDAESINGSIEINPQGWIYPIKGVVFIIEDKNNC